MSATKISATAKGLHVSIYVFRSDKKSLPITCADSNYGFRVGTTPDQLEEFREKFEDLFVELVERKKPISMQ